MLVASLYTSYAVQQLYIMVCKNLCKCTCNYFKLMTTNCASVHSAISRNKLVTALVSRYVHVQCIYTCVLVLAIFWHSTLNSAEFAYAVHVGDWLGWVANDRVQVISM